MDPQYDLWLVGLSHRTAPVAVRERYVVGAEDTPSCLHALAELPGLREAAVLSTCNRTEVLVTVEKGREIVEPLGARLFRNLAPEHRYAFHDVHAVIHLFRVAAGLDSLVVGESEVLGQLKRAHESAQAAGTLGNLLGPLLQQAIRVGKRVRSETAVGQGSLSVARLAVELAGHVVGRFASSRALIVGAGETGLLVGRHLVAAGVGTLEVANRTRERAEQVAQELHGRAAGLEEVPGLVAEADLVFVCLDGGSFRLGPELFEAKRRARRDKPLFVADLSVPRAVEAAVRTQREVLLYDLDDLARAVAEHRKGREAEAEHAGEMLVAEVHKFLSLRTYARFAPSIERLRARFEEVRDETLDRVAAANASPRELELAHELARKLLDVALEQMKDSARQTRSEAVLDQEYRRFLENL